ncbi:MAG: hypothetical protein ACOZAM_20335 [Pseudomonadota bacterium]
MRGRVEDEPRPANGAERKARAAENARAVSREAESLVRKLHAAARDVVEAIDGDLPRELERRYVSGAEDVYTRNLLEDRGRRMPRLVERRYREERLVRGRVDAYVRLFERLLDALAETPQGDQLVDASLASESGKLYLLLAQASGRISPQ